MYTRLKIGGDASTSEESRIRDVAYRVSHSRESHTRRGSALSRPRKCILHSAGLVAINLEFTSRLARGANYRRTVKLPAIFPSSRRRSRQVDLSRPRAYLITRVARASFRTIAGQTHGRATGIANREFAGVRIAGITRTTENTRRRASLSFDRDP